MVGVISALTEPLNSHVGDAKAAIDIQILKKWTAFSYFCQYVIITGVRQVEAT